MTKLTSSSFEVIARPLYIVVGTNVLHKKEPMGRGPNSAIYVVIKICTEVAQWNCSEFFRISRGFFEQSA